MSLYEQIAQKPLIIAGPCVIENEDMVMDLAEGLALIAEQMGFLLVFKASFDKANRTSVEAYRGPGLEKGIRILEKVKQTFGLPITTDIHESYQAEPVAQVADILQIPAFLCRQTDLLVAAAQTGRIVNIKKAQFLSGTDMRHPAQKVASVGNRQVMLTERGSSYGHHDLVVDFRNVIDMQKLGYPVVMDITHSCQKPGAGDGKSGGNREYAPYFAYAAAAMGVRSFFFETHREPEKALSDGPNMIPFHQVRPFLQRLSETIAVSDQYRRVKSEE